MAIAAGTRLGRYEIRTQIGAGGMGEVYLAQDTKLGRPVAVKVLPAELAAVADRMRRFVQEAKVVSSLNHPNILTIHEIDESDSGHFIATEFVDGETLRQRLRGEPMKLAEVLDVATQVAGALAAAHAAGVVHRDIKPENIMRRRDGLVKVLDFGLAKLTEPNDGVGEPTAMTAAPTLDALTEAGIVLGTVRYMSPEQVRGHAVDARTDIFSFGLVLYEMVTRRLPFDGTTSVEAVASMLGDTEPQPLSRYAAAVPAELERIVSKALRKDRNERYQTMKDLLLDLKSLQQGSSSNAAAPAVVPSSRRSLQRGAVVAALSLAAVGAALWFAGRHSPVAAIDSIAVLPFENRTHDDKIEYLSDGLTESLINSLSQLPHVKVIARNSVFSYKNQAATPEEVARRLNVRAILTGRVLMQGDTLDVRAELTDTQTNTQLWGDHYTQRAADVFAVQDQIARQVIDALKVHLTGGEQEQVAKRYTRSAEAYQLYLQGRYVLNGGSEGDFGRAIALFDRAIAIDPQFALAYSARGEAFFSMGDFNLSMKDASPKAKENAVQALVLDDTLTDARVLLANIKFQYDWNFAGAEEEFKRVIAQNPNHAEARHQYTYLLAMTGRTTEAVSEIRRAQQLDPVNPMIGVDTLLPYYLGRQYDQAIVQGRKAMDVFPNLFIAHMGVGSSLIQQGDFVAGIAELEKAKALEPNPIVLGNLGYAYARAGRRADAQRILADLKAESQNRYVAAYAFACIYAGLNDRDEAFAWLEKAYQDRSWWLVWIKTDPKMEPLRDDPRFADFMRRVGFPE